jgi:hypothetical protein
MGTLGVPIGCPVGRGHGCPALPMASCKGRGVCPSCNGRRMAQTAAHLVDRVIPPVPVRQWVISVPKRLRCFLADRQSAVAALTRIFISRVERLLRTAAGLTRDGARIARDSAPCPFCTASDRGSITTCTCMCARPTASSCQPVTGRRPVARRPTGESSCRATFDRAIFQGRIDELPDIDIHSLSRHSMPRCGRPARRAVSRRARADEKNPALSVDRKLFGTSTIGSHPARSTPAVAPHDPPRSADACRSAIGRPVLILFRSRTAG